jgi:FAD/FMN-containing dehydrogenase
MEEPVLAQKDKILELLSDVVGLKNASNDPAVLAVYSRDQHWPFAPPRMPDYVVRPKTTEEVQKIMRIANRYQIPLIPVSSGLNVRGLTIPTHGGIILDLKRMDFVNVDKEMRTATVESGISCAKLADEAEKVGLRPLTIGGPATANVVSNYMLRGLPHLLPRYGNTGEQVLGMEIVLPNGDVLYTGSAAFPNTGPHFKYFGPDLGGLFQGQPGTMGVVTRMTVRLYPFPERQEMAVCGFRTREGEKPEDALRRATMFVHTLALQDPPVASTCALMHWLSASIMMVKSREDIPKFKGTVGDWVVIVGIEGTNDYVAYSKSVTEKIIKDQWDNIDEGREVYLMPKMMRDEFRAPSRIFRWFRLGNYYALAWWGALNKTVDYYFEALKVWQELGLTEELAMVLMPGFPYNGQCSYYEYDSFWDATNSEMTEKIKEFTKIMYEKLIDIGIYCWFRPYPGIVETTFPRLKGVMPQLWRDIKKLIDPNNIMNPGKIFPE